MDKFLQIPVFGTLMGSLIEGMKYVQSFFTFLFNTELLEFLELIPIGTGILSNILTSIKNWLVNFAFGVFRIPEDVSIAGFILFYGVFVIFAVWIIKFFMDIVT